MPDAQRFARTVLAAFTAAGNRTEAQIAKADGPSSSTMTKLRKVAAGESEMAEPREPTWTKIENAARWRPGSARAVWDGGKPVSRGVPSDRDERIERLRADLNRIMSELERLEDDTG